MAIRPSVSIAALITLAGLAISGCGPDANDALTSTPLKPGEGTEIFVPVEPTVSQLVEAFSAFKGSLTAKTKADGLTTSVVLVADQNSELTDMSVQYSSDQGTATNIVRTVHDEEGGGTHQEGLLMVKPEFSTFELDSFAGRWFSHTFEGTARGLPATPGALVLLPAGFYDESGTAIEDGSVKVVETDDGVEFATGDCVTGSQMLCDGEHVQLILEGRRRLTQIENMNVAPGDKRPSNTISYSGEIIIPEGTAPAPMTSEELVPAQALLNGIQSGEGLYSNSGLLPARKVLALGTLLAITPEDMTDVSTVAHRLEELVPGDENLTEIGVDVKITGGVVGFAMKGLDGRCHMAAVTRTSKPRFDTVDIAGANGCNAPSAELANTEWPDSANAAPSGM